MISRKTARKENVMSIFDDPVSAHNELVGDLLEKFVHRHLITTHIVSDVETVLDDMFIFITVTTFEDGHRLAVKDENQQILFEDSDVRFKSTIEAVEKIKECYGKL